MDLGVRGVGTCPIRVNVINKESPAVAANGNGLKGQHPGVE